MTFREELEQILNRSSLENGSDTPDFVLAEYLVACLNAFDNAVNFRERWYGRGGCAVPLAPRQPHWPVCLNDPPDMEGGRE